MGSPDITPGDVTPLSLLMKISSILLLATLGLLAQARRVHKPSVSHHLLTDSPVRSQIKHKPTNFNKVMKLKSLKPSKKTEKLYKKMLAKEKLRMKKKHLKKQHTQQTP